MQHMSSPLPNVSDTSMSQTGYQYFASNSVPIILIVKHAMRRSSSRHIYFTSRQLLRIVPVPRFGSSHNLQYKLSHVANILAIVRLTLCSLRCSKQAHGHNVFLSHITKVQGTHAVAGYPKHELYARRSSKWVQAKENRITL